MHSHKGYGRKGRNTRPFMPIHGRKPQTPPPEDKVMRVGDEAMIEENRPAAPGSGPANGTGGGGAAGPGPEKLDAAGEARLNELRAERDDYLELARRERADFDNYRKRVEREMKDLKKASLAGFLKEFFGPLDDMDRVLAESSKSQSFEALATGVRIMEENFWRVLAKAGVRKIDAKGKPFDPNIHEAMTAVPSADAPPNTVLEVFENGYKLDDFVLRPARVVVSRAPDNE